MSKFEVSSDALQQAMQEALAAVERRAGEKHHANPDPQTSAPAATPERHPALLERAEAQVADLKARLQQLNTDFDKWRARTEQERAQLELRAVEQVVLKVILPVIDNLELAVAHGTDPQEPVAVGVRMVLKQLLAALAERGIEPFDSRGTPFDPQRHEALAQQISQEQPPGTVLQETQRGYQTHGRILRPARVVVAAAAK